VNPKRRSSGGAGEEPRRRSIGPGTGRRAAKTRRHAVRVALCHDLIRAGKALDRRGMIVASEGNLSARLRPDRFLLTRRGRRKGELTTRDFVELGISEPEDSPARAAASTEHRMHMAAYAVRRDVESLLHAHPVALTAFAVRGEPPDYARFDEARALLGAVALVTYFPSGSEALAEAVGRALSDATKPNLVLLQNHGALAVGGSVDEALARLEIAEHLAAALLAAERPRSG
jgi:L-fuculose-phosphate aldolase